MCSGYADILRNVCALKEIEAKYIVGFPPNDKIGHAWNQVKLNGKWYNCDATWADDSNAKYYLLSDEEFYESHKKYSEIETVVHECPETYDREMIDKISTNSLLQLIYECDTPVVLELLQKENHIWLGNSQDDTIFCGKLENKDEMKLILKQLLEKNPIKNMKVFEQYSVEVLLESGMKLEMLSSEFQKMSQLYTKKFAFDEANQKVSFADKIQDENGQMQFLAQYPLLQKLPFVKKHGQKQEIAKQQKQPKQELPNRFEQYALTGDNLVKFNQKTEKLLVDSALMGQEPSQENTLNQYDVDRGEN